MSLPSRQRREHLVVASSGSRNLHEKSFHWTLRRFTRAAQKIPLNATKQCDQSLLRQALQIRDFRILDVLRVNIDQTNGGYFLSSVETYELIRAKQVNVLGKEEKRTFTVVIGISAAGHVLPFQVIWTGMTSAVRPKPSPPKYQEAMELGFCFEPSKTRTNWSILDTMIRYVDKILVPYYDTHKTQLGLPANQPVILQLNCWKVHRSQAFNDQMKQDYPTIFRHFIPGGCTGIFQPADVGISRVFKASLHRSQHASIVHETLTQLNNGKRPEEVKLNTTIGVLRDCTVGLLVDAYHAFNKAELVEKVSEAIDSNLTQ